MNSLVQFATVAVLAAGMTSPASALRFDVTGAVTEYSGSDPRLEQPGVAVPIGTPVDVILSFDDTFATSLEPLEEILARPVTDFVSSGFFSSVFIGSGFAAFIDDFEAAISVNADFFSIGGLGTGTFSGNDGDVDYFSDDLSGTINVYYGVIPATAPVSLGELYAALETPGTFGNASFMFGNVQGSEVAENDLGYIGDVNLRVRIPAPIPLPAGLPLVLTALGAFGFLHRRRRQRAA